MSSVPMSQPATSETAGARRSVASRGGLGLRGLNRLLLLWLPLIFFIFFLLFPFYSMLLTSLKQNAELYDLRMNPFIFNPPLNYTWGPITIPAFWTIQPTLDHYIFLFEKTPFTRWFLNTLLVATISTVLSLVISILAGYALARLRFKGAATLGLLIFVSYLVPQTLLFIPLFDVVKTFNLGDTYWALILTYPTFLIPFCSWMLMGYFRSIPRELEESAMIDGSSRVGALWRIVLPLALPGLLSAGIFAFTLSWNEFTYSLVFITSDQMKTLPVGINQKLLTADVYPWGQVMGAALLASVPVAVVYAFFADYYVAGLTAGAVKG